MADDPFCRLRILPPVLGVRNQTPEPVVPFPRIAAAPDRMAPDLWMKSTYS